MNGREHKSKAKETSHAIVYDENDWEDNMTAFCSDDHGVETAILYVDAVRTHFVRSRNTSQLSDAVCTQIFERAMEFFENDADGLTMEQLSDLVHLSALCILEADDMAPETFEKWQSLVLKWALRDQELRKSPEHAERLCACVAAVYSTFVPVADTVSSIKLLLPIIKGTVDASCRGQFIKLAAQVAHPAEAQQIAPLIREALLAPAEELVVLAVRTSAIFLDRFAGDAGLEPDVLEQLAIPTASQRECGVSKASIERRCRDVYEYIRSEEERRPQQKIVDTVDFAADRFDHVEILQQLTKVYTSGVEGPFGRTRNGIFRICRRALGMKHNARDRAVGVSVHTEHLAREQVHRVRDKERASDRHARHAQLDDNNAQDFE
jgi:hypothetical protein